MKRIGNDGIDPTRYGKHKSVNGPERSAAEHAPTRQTNAPDGIPRKGASRVRLPRIRAGRTAGEKITTGFASDAAIETLADHLSGNWQKLGIVPAQFAGANAIKSRLAKGKALPLLPGHEAWTGIIDRSGNVQSNDKELVQFLGQLDQRRLIMEGIPQQGLPIAVLVKAPLMAEPHEEYLTGKIIDHFKASGEITDEKGRVFEFRETVTWPFFHDLIAGNSTVRANSALARGISELPGYELVIPDNIDARTLDALEAHVAAQRRRLLAVDLAELQYSGRADWKDTAVSLTLSSAIGSGGDFVIHRIFPENAPHNVVAYVAESAAKVFLLLLTDIGDNAIGELETARGDLLANNITPSFKTFTGAENLFELAVNILKGHRALNGDGRIFAKRALTAGLKGATTGAPFAAATGFMVTTNGMDPVIQAPVGGALSVGFALSIPYDFRSAARQVQSAVHVLIDESKIQTPERGFADEDAKASYVRDIALQEIVSRQSNSSSAKAFAKAPGINAAILASPLLGIPPEVAELVFMGAAPPMENLSKLGSTIWETKVTRPRAMAQLRAMVLATPGGFDKRDQETKLARSFARRWPHSVARAITVGAKPPRPSSQVTDTEETAGG